MVDPLDHILNDFFWRVPDPEFFAELRVEGFKERLVEVGYGFFFTEDVEEARLNAVESFASEIQDLLKLDGIQRSGIGHFAEELAQDRNTQVMGGNPPVEAGAGQKFWCSTPENPCGEDSI